MPPGRGASRDRKRDGNDTRVGTRHGRGPCVPACLGTFWRAKELSRELVLQATEFVKRLACPKQGSSTDAFAATYVVDSGASRDGLPPAFFPPDASSFDIAAPP